MPINAGILTNKLYFLAQVFPSSDITFIWYLGFSRPDEGRQGGRQTVDPVKFGSFWGSR